MIYKKIFTFAGIVSMHSPLKNLAVYSKKYTAFTLAEVLITLGIIGVVAAMTLPSVIQNQQKHSLEVATKKFYTNMSQAIKLYMADQGVDDLRNTPLTAVCDENHDCDYESAKAGASNFMHKYFKVIKECKDNDSSCWVDKYTKFNGESQKNSFDLFSDNTYVLSDGMAVCFNAPDDYYPGTITVDVNGKKGPNRIGYDVWSMSLFYDGTLDEGGVTPECKKSGECPYGDSASESRESRFGSCKDSNSYGGCFGHFLENNFKFDY